MAAISGFDKKFIFNSEERSLVTENKLVVVGHVV